MTLQHAFSECSKQGLLLPQERKDQNLIRSLIQVAEEDLQAADITEQAQKYNATFKLRYDALRALCEAYSRTHLIKPQNHKCLFVFVCKALPELDWTFFEGLRTKRNNIQYRGATVAQQEVNNTKLQLTLTCKVIQEQLNAS